MHAKEKLSDIKGDSNALKRVMPSHIIKLSFTILLVMNTHHVINLLEKCKPSMKRGYNRAV